MNSRTKGSKRKKQKQQNAIIIHDHNNKETIKNVEDYHYQTKKNSIAQFYQKKEDCNLILTNESKFMNPGFWNRVHEHIISSTSLESSSSTNKYNICQVKDNNESSHYCVSPSRIMFVKESRFSYIRPVDGATRLIVYNCSNITSLENVVHRGSKVVVEVPDGCMILFTNHTVHAGVNIL